MTVCIYINIVCTWISQFKDVFPVLSKPVEDGGKDLFQIQFGPVEHCILWNVSIAFEILYVIFSTFMFYIG